MTYTYEQKQSARRKVYEAVKSGELLKPQTCTKCPSNTNIQGHPSDYSKPLDVTWLCYRCHRELHVSLGTHKIKAKRQPLKMSMKEVLNRASLASKDRLRPTG